MAGSIRAQKRVTSVTDWRVVFNVMAMTYLLKAVTGFGYLALTWSTVVLLGGFVTVLHKKDFWCLTVISMTQAARIFNDFAERLVHSFVVMLAANIRSLASREFRTFLSVVGVGASRQTPAAVSKWCWVLRFLYVGTIMLPFQATSCVTMWLYRYSGPAACIALAFWRIVQRDYGGDDGSNGNLVPALDLFYSLVLAQGVLYTVWAFWPLLNNKFTTRNTIRRYRQALGLPDERWCLIYLRRYLSDTRARCWREPASIRWRTLHDFAMESLDSGSWEEMLSGARLLDAYVKKEENIRPQLLPSRPRIQKLIDVLGLRPEDEASRGMVEHAAHIVAHLSGDIHLAQFPGAMECISSLLQYQAWTKKQGGGGPNELILQGLIILEGLAFDNHNCRAICSTPGLLGKIMAPLSCANLMHDISNNVDWTKVVSGTFKVLHKLIQAPGKSSKRLRRAIYSNKLSMGNLQSILQHEDDDAGIMEDLQMGAMGILTKLALDLSINLSKETIEKLIDKLLHIFLAHEGGGEEPVAELKPIKEWAGRTLLLLSTGIESSTALIMTKQNNIVDRLTGKLDAKNTTYRTIAAQILGNLCAHSDLDKQWVKETLLPKVLTEILHSKRLATENGVPPPIDEENPPPSAPRNDEENKSSDGGNEEQTTAFCPLFW